MCTHGACTCTHTGVYTCAPNLCIDGCEHTHMCMHVCPCARTHTHTCVLTWGRHQHRAPLPCLRVSKAGALGRLCVLLLLQRMLAAAFQRPGPGAFAGASLSVLSRGDFAPPSHPCLTGLSCVSSPPPTPTGMCWGSSSFGGRQLGSNPGSDVHELFDLGKWP